ncbi:signal peptidase I [Streptomyces indicus]|uniref:Signal peptidase I n=1 Tax=Streptomyces indicus TaxID=417292 RepID=A0A1G8W0P8_9ACTN|nr:signal peptidase I [Streptomyces indicus]SDJ71030.1 signal peptidase I [Streptomyces indicus]
MDTEADRTERDRSSAPSGEQEEGSRSARLRPSSQLPARLFARMSQVLDSGMRRLLAGLVVIAVVLLLVSRFVMQPFLIPSGSMEPTLRDGDRVLVNKLAYRFGGEPGRGDVVVFDGSGYFGNSDYVKRVGGVGGDHIVCCDEDGRIEVNGEPVEETYLHRGDAPSSVPFDVVVPDGTLFLLGDHRSDSSDSRDRLGSPGGGFLPVEQVIGRVEWIGWPVGRWADIDSAAALADVPVRSAPHG